MGHQNPRLGPPKVASILRWSNKANPHAEPGWSPSRELSSVATPSAQQPPCADARRCSSAEGLVSQTDVCMDPACPENDCDECFDYDKYCEDCAGDPQDVCEECSEHDALCQDCFEDCTSECDVPLTDCGEICGLKHDYAPAGSYSEFFGSQVADMFGPSASSPQIPLGLHRDMNRAIFYPNGQRNPAALAPEPASPTSFASSGGPPFSPTPIRPLGGLELLKAVGSASINQSRLQDEPYDIALKSTNPWKVNTASIVAAEDPTSASLDSLVNAIRPSSNSSLNGIEGSKLNSEEPAPEGPPLKALSCQWADAAGQPCGKLFNLTDELHDHLRETHNTKSAVFCRWIGCPVSALTANPHRYANSVQRHTWGHSGYRPYKCSACGEGFAAANVRDEHFSNIHLKEKVFCCDICSHQCTSAPNLKRHIDERHRAERYQCEFCNRNGKITLFPRGPNLARHFRKCKYVLASFPEANGAEEGKIEDAWYPSGYKKGHHGMDKAKITPPNYLPC